MLLFYFLVLKLTPHLYLLRYQTEGEGRSLFSKIEGDKDTIMGLPVKKIKDYLRNLE
jgi:hypothetical protein